ncbi:hypothetical protein I7I50_07809 [Histoplasma capsulatum G186AR]|uniref:Uncharacterized protein n=1 Tax=Ajellomyces capsulatus TaxID=5037 RepID=A0A8H7YK93_AJECA|nr:hypothetical protein I7I52_08325 [Histoplasma capsulatum]QSS68407.1 hypothetical protein I7I50_07809 [Histoplasma capsulatum G186AR]
MYDSDLWNTQIKERNNSAHKSRKSSPPFSFFSASQLIMRLHVIAYVIIKWKQTKQTFKLTYYHHILL